MNRRNLLWIAVAVAAVAVSALIYVHYAPAEPPAIPRRVAYPRVYAYPDSFVAIDSLPLALQANAGAVVSRPRPNWVDIAYPAYGAVVHLTILDTDPNHLAAELDNRRQRIDLNLNGAAASARTIDNGRFQSLIVTATDPIATPVQVLATDNSRYVVSGSAYFEHLSPLANRDSLAPMVSRIEADLVEALSNLK